ncbi:orotidine 5'-phosphate decarboxylase [Treponema primitia]|uniref:3-hexulose-6-phosphate synthase n=1 Tax=Treponema primitia TaxID=88058 RepID=UPI0039801704
MMELLLALDFITLPDAKRLLHRVIDCINIVEIGTPFIVQDGVHAVREIRNEFPNIKIFADIKIMDAGSEETEMAIKAGADIVSVLGAADDATIKGAVTTAHKYGKKILVDMIACSDIACRATHIDTIGVDYICVHTAFDIQNTGINPLKELIIVNGVVKNAQTAVAGGVNIATLPEIIQAHPAIIIVGGAITTAADKYFAAKQMYDLVHKNE